MNTEAAQILDSAPATTVAPETAKEQAAPASESPKEDKVSSKLEVLIRREQAARQAEMAAKAERTEIEKLRAEVEQGRSKYNELLEARKNPKKALELLGLNYDELTQSMLNDGQITPDVEIKKLREELEGFKKKTLDDKELEKQRDAQKQKEMAEQQEKLAVENFQTEISSYISDNPDRYELITFEQAQGLVYDVVDEHYNRTLKASIEELQEKGEDVSQARGKVMLISEAADKVEAHFEKRENDKKKLKKTQTLWGNVPKSAIEKIVAERKEAQKPTPRTLTNQMSATPMKRNTPTSDEERIQRAIAYANNLRR